MDCIEIAGYAIMLGFFWLCWKGWCEDTRKMKRQAQKRRDRSRDLCGND